MLPKRSEKRSPPQEYTTVEKFNGHHASYVGQTWRCLDQRAKAPGHMVVGMSIRRKRWCCASLPLCISLPLYYPLPFGGSLPRVVVRDLKPCGCWGRGGGDGKEEEGADGRSVAGVVCSTPTFLLQMKMWMVKHSVYATKSNANVPTGTLSAHAVYFCGFSRKCGSLVNRRESRRRDPHRAHTKKVSSVDRLHANGRDARPKAELALADRRAGMQYCSLLTLL